MLGVPLKESELNIEPTNIRINVPSACNSNSGSVKSGEDVLSFPETTVSLCFGTTRVSNSQCYRNYL